MNLLDCCTGCSDCCSSINCCDCCSDCCSMDGCCPDCYSGGSLFGGIKFGDGLTLDGDTLKVTLTGGSDCTCQPYVLPTASETLKGGIKVGHSLLMTDESLNVALDTVSSTIEGFMWIDGTNQSVSGGTVTSNLNVADDADIAAMLRSVFGV